MESKHTTSHNVISLLISSKISSYPKVHEMNNHGPIVLESGGVALNSLHQSTTMLCEESAISSPYLSPMVAMACKVSKLMDLGKDSLRRQISFRTSPIASASSSRVVVALPDLRSWRAVSNSDSGPKDARNTFEAFQRI